MLESSVLCIVSAKKNSDGSRSMKKTDEKEVAAVGNASCSLDSGRSLSAVPDF